MSTEQDTSRDENTQDDAAQTNESAQQTETSPKDGGKGRRSVSAEQLEEEGDIAADFLERLLDIADLDGDIDVTVERDRASVAVIDSEDGPAPRALVGPNGKVLEALQELTRLAVHAETGDRTRLMLDVAGYRADRRASLIELAQRAIEDVRASGHQRELEPMTAFERKVVHDEVLAAGLSSESDGVEPNRYVVITPAG